MPPITAALLCAAVAAASDPHAELQAAADAIRAVDGLQFGIAWEAGGAARTTTPRVHGRARLQRAADDETLGGHYAIEGQYELATSPEPDQAALYYDGATVWSVRAAADMTITGDPASSGLMLLGLGVDPCGLVLDLLSNAPLAAPLAASDVHDAGRQTVRGVPCRVVRADLTDGEWFWYLGEDDHLPRRVEQFGHEGPGFSFRAVELFDLEPIPEPRIDMFRPPAETARTLALDVERLPGPGEGPPALPLADVATGERFDPVATRGRFTVLEFWATWCGACRASLPLIGRLAERVADRADVVLVQSFDDRDPAAVLARAGAKAPLRCGRATPESLEAWGVTALPLVIVLDPEGTVVFGQLGWRPDLEDAIASVVGAEER